MKNFGFGMMRLPLLDANDEGSIDYEQVKKMADLFLSKGFTYVDTAWMYHNGLSENAVKVAFSERYPRESFYLADKMPVGMMQSKDEYEKIFEEQLKRCGVTYFDNYLIHNIFEETADFVEKTDGFAFSKKMLEEGKIKHLGFSFHGGPELLDKVLTAHPEVEFVQIQLNYLDWDNAAIQAGANYDVIVKHGKRVVVMEPVKGGTLAKVPEEVEAAYKKINPDLSIASWAVRFAASQPGVDVVLSGMSSLEQMEDNISYMEYFKPLNEEEKEALKDAVAVINSGIAIPCTGCHYCVNHGAGCPMNIAIPEYFAMVNDIKKFGQTWGVMAQYRNTRQLGYGQPADCIACGQCEQHCPQHIQIIDTLSKIRELEGIRTDTPFTLYL